MTGKATESDILAWIESVEPPKYPWKIDADLAEQGRLLFGENCSRCHGAYGKGGNYEQKTIPIDVTSSSPWVHFPASPTDMRAVLTALPAGVADGLTGIELGLGDLAQSQPDDDFEAEPDVDGTMLADAFIELWAALAATGFGLVLDGATDLKPSLDRVRRYAGDRRTMRLISRFDQRDSGKPAFEPFTFALAERSAKRSQVDLLWAEAALQTIAHQTGSFMVDHDLFLTPVLGSPPVRLGRIDQSLPWDEFVEIIFRYVAFTPLGNFAGLPAMSVPLHWTSDGLPVGSHFLARLGAEETLFSLAGQLERAQPWADRRPPLEI